MRASLLVIAAVSLAACSAAPGAGGGTAASDVVAPAASDPTGRPELFDATPDGGRVSNAAGEYAEQAAEIAAAHCLATERNVRIVGASAERHALIFTCVAD